MRILITGGARSGKSRFAEQYAARLGENGIYIATSQAFDDEMRSRIRMHRLRREQGAFPWTTREEPYALEEALPALEGEYRISGAGGQTGAAGVVLVDCLTLWLSNWLLRCGRESDVEERLEARIAGLAEKVAGWGQTAPGASPHLLLVTNEVGDGIVPEYPLGRMFRDAAGRLNQRLAAVCEQVFLVTAGIPVELKSREFRLP
jgi:adenosylcobinamide kinase/adenosylcobinamide-phosphate guanylyltransferase